jgi:outer membrane biosynthesis protein TonB
MRDSHRMKEKFELSLDSRQVTSLLGAGLVVLGAVFVLGVVVGKRLAGAPAGNEPPDLLSALDRKAAAMVEARKEPTLTFQDELTRKSAALPREQPKPVIVEQRPPVVPEVRAPAVPAPAAVPEPKPSPAAEVKPATADAKPPAAETKPAEALPAAPPVEKAPEERPSSSPLRPLEKSPQQAVARTVAELAAAQKPAAVLPTEAVAGGRYCIQVKSTQEKDDANRFAARLRDRGYAPYVQQVELPERGTWFRVRMGSFENREAAGRYLADFKRETKIDAIVSCGK